MYAINMWNIKVFLSGESINLADLIRVTTGGSVNSSWDERDSQPWWVGANAST
jgi:hypothetical protein